MKIRHLLMLAAVLAVSGVTATLAAVSGTGTTGVSSVVQLVPPSNLAINADQTAKSAALSWDTTPSMADGYYVRWRIQGQDVWRQITAAPKTNTGYTITGLDSGAYDARVISVFGEMESAPLSGSFVINEDAPSSSETTSTPTTTTQGGSAYSGASGGSTSSSTSSEESSTSEAILETAEEPLLMSSNSYSDEKIIIVPQSNLEASVAEIIPETAKTEEAEEVATTQEIISSTQSDSTMTGDQFFYGVTEPDAEVVLVAQSDAGEEILGTTTADSSGIYVFDDVPNLSAGTYDIVILSNNTRKTIEQITVEPVDYQPEITSFAGVDTAELASEGEDAAAENISEVQIATDNDQPTITGTIDPAQLESSDTSELTGTAVWHSKIMISKFAVNADGSFEFQPPSELEPGQHRVSYSIENRTKKVGVGGQISFVVIPPDTAEELQAAATGTGQQIKSTRVISKQEAKELIKTIGPGSQASLLGSTNLFSLNESGGGYLLWLLIPVIAVFGYLLGRRHHRDKKETPTPESAAQ